MWHERRKLGVHSETGRLRQVIVCKPGRAHRRLTPENKDELLFDDVFWVKQARKDHDAFADLMRAEGVEVLDTGELLAEVLALDEARQWVLDHRITPQDVGVGMLDDLRAWLNEMESADLAEILIGGLTVSDLPFEPAGMFGAYLGVSDLSCRRFPTCCSPATTARGSMAGSRSTRCTGRPGSPRRC